MSIKPESVDLESITPPMSQVSFEQSLTRTTFTRQRFISLGRYLAGVINSVTGFSTCVIPSVYPATKEQTSENQAITNKKKLHGTQNQVNTDEVGKLRT